jgi:hypothetical protein
MTGHACCNDTRLLDERNLRRLYRRFPPSRGLCRQRRRENSGARGRRNPDLRTGLARAETYHWRSLSAIGKITATRNQQQNDGTARSATLRSKAVCLVMVYERLQSEIAPAVNR